MPTDQLNHVRAHLETLPLSDDARGYFLTAVESVLNRPSEFRPVSKWLSKRFSEHAFSVRRRAMHRALVRQGGKARRDIIILGRALRKLESPDSQHRTAMLNALGWNRGFRQDLFEKLESLKQATKVERLQEVVQDILANGNSSEISFPCRVVGVAALLISPINLEDLGEFGRWDWRSSNFRTFTRIIGREEVLFYRDVEQQGQRDVPPKPIEFDVVLEHRVNEFVELLRIALIAIDRPAKSTAHDQRPELTVTEFATLSGVHKGHASRMHSKGERLTPELAFSLKTKRNKAMPSPKKITAATKLKRPWFCKKCVGEPYIEKPTKCPKCGSTEFEK